MSFQGIKSFVTGVQTLLAARSDVRAAQAARADGPLPTKFVAISHPDYVRERVIAALNTPKSEGFGSVMFLVGPDSHLKREIEAALKGHATVVTQHPEYGGLIGITVEL